VFLFSPDGSENPTSLRGKTCPSWRKQSRGLKRTAGGFVLSNPIRSAPKTKKAPVLQLMLS